MVKTNVNTLKTNSADKTNTTQQDSRRLEYVQTFEEDYMNKTNTSEDENLELYNVEGTVFHI